MGIDVDIIKKFKGFDLNIKFKTDNSKLGILGASGSGKSITLKCISGIVTPDEGKIILNDRVLFDSKAKINIPVRKRKVGFLFQNYTLFPKMTVEENIVFGLPRGFSKSEKEEIITKKIETMKLFGMEKRYPYELSGGQQQRVALARSLVVNPEILLLDEPFSSLDEYLRNYMIEQLKQDISEFKGTTILVTHNREEAYQICNDILIVSNGKVDLSGHKEDIFNQPKTLTSAKLTGCKNISRIKKIDDYTLEATEWNIIIVTMEKVLDNITYAGIRAHYLELSEKSIDYDKNVFECWTVFTSANLFRVMVYLKFNKPPQDQNDYHVIWDISKEEWAILKDKPQPFKIWINPEKIILLRDSKESFDKN